MKYKYSFYLILLAIFACQKKSGLDINSQMGKSLLQKYSHGMIISCFRCSCIDNYLTKERISFFNQKGIVILADTGCVLAGAANTIYFPQKDLDSLWERNYNVLLFKKQHDEYIFDHLKTEYDLSKKTKSFFSDK
ncbi:hypothetical protein [Ferruginibacter sp. HRS2-29]|uniref:hypothetical protein n=1 Tax=Ferruginibacter sp. HRS2-29 TaxID=2487334 RepID=UPI0020CCFF9E|nr:hypothetical protein [Ferruginibacter sp. HRS2-29]MCP9752745.1 hypothetical protein [Ferruginibacter sp. HRS2-29]